MKIKAKLNIFVPNTQSSQDSVDSFNMNLGREFLMEFPPQIGNKLQFFMQPSHKNTNLLDVTINESSEICTGIFIIRDIIFRPEIDEVMLVIEEEFSPSRTSKEARLLCRQLILGYNFVEDS